MGHSSRMQTGRSVVYAKNGGAAASQPLAVSAAISILKQGGSFIDAAPLAAWGHGSSVQIMQVLPNGTFAFGSDPRCEGHASGI